MSEKPTTAEERADWLHEPPCNCTTGTSQTSHWTGCSWGRWYKRQMSDKEFIRRLIADADRLERERAEARAEVERLRGDLVWACDGHDEPTDDTQCRVCAVGENARADLAESEQQ